MKCPLIVEWTDAIPALTTDQMREVDRALIEDIGISLVQMMENAGRHLAALAREMLGDSVVGKNIVVLAGKGNNGGGGMVAARRLANWGAKVIAVLVTPPNEYRDVPARQLLILHKMGVQIQFGAGVQFVHHRQDLILDALIGYGLHGPPMNGAANLIRQANAADVKTFHWTRHQDSIRRLGRFLIPAFVRLQR